jgi:LmbE family N-acetylglucosaminyl deacetylase
MQEKVGTSLGPADAHLHALRSYAGTGKPTIDEPEVTSNSRILVLAAHLEDPIIGCGGTICKLAKKGAHIKMLYMTDSCYGADIKPSSELVPMALKNAEYSMAMLRCYESEHLDLPSRGMRCDNSGKSRLRHAIDYYSPDLVFIPSLRDKHQDNRMTGLLAASTLKEYDRTLTPYSDEVWGGHLPNNLVDITDVMEDKVAALRSCHSQTVIDNREPMTKANGFRLSTVIENRHYEQFLRQRREDFVFMAWQLRVYGHINRT